MRNIENRRKLQKEYRDRKQLVSQERMVQQRLMPVEDLWALVGYKPQEVDK